MLKKMLTGNIQVVEDVSNWADSIKCASLPLLEKGCITKSYLEKMITNIKELGPYVVLMPKVAMPHARPEDGVKKESLALLKVNKGVTFSEEKDDVQLIFILASLDSNSHVELIMALTELLGNEESVEKMIKSKTPRDILSILEKKE